MSDDYNPYKAPDSDLTSSEPVSTPTNEKMYTNTMLEHMKNTKPWVRLISILTFISIGFMALIAIIMFFMGSMLGGNMYGNSEFGSTMGTAMGIGMGILYLGFAAVYIAPAVFLHRYANSIRDLLNLGNTQLLEDSLKHQKSFWKYVGILSIIGIALIVIMIIGSIIVGIIVAANSTRF